MPYIGNPISDFNVSTAMLNTDSVTSIKIDDGTIVNADINDSAAIAMSKLALSITNSEINASAAIAGTKISPNFGSQTVTASNLTLSDNDPIIQFTDANNDPDYRILVESGIWRVQDTTNGNANRLQINADGHIDIAGNLDVGAGIDVTGVITGTGDLTLSNGGTDRLKMTHAGGGQFVIKNPSAASLTFGTNNQNNELVIANGGNVGVGTASPAQLLDIASTAPNLRFTDTVDGHSEIDGNAASLKFNADKGNAKADTTITFAVDNSEKMRIDSSGRLLLGTTTEGGVNADDLTIANSGHTGITIRSGTSSVGSLYFSDGTSGDDEYRGAVQYNHTDNFLRFYSDATERMRIDSSGRVLIGGTDATNPAGESDYQGLKLKGSKPYLVFHEDDRSGEAQHGYVAHTTGALFVAKMAGRIGFMTSSSGAPTEKLTLASSGNLGIGTTSPSSKLHINCGSDNTAVQINSTDAGSFYQAIDNTGESIFGHSGANAVISVDPGGSVSSSAIVFQVDGNSEKMRIDSSGRVIIGTTAAAHNEKVRITGRTVDGSSTTIDLDGTGTSGPLLEMRSSSSAADDLAVLVLNQASLKSAIGCGRVNTNNWGTDLRFYTHKDATSNQHQSYERMRIDSSGNVGIGTSPQRTLHQHLSSSSANYHQFTNSTTGSGGGDGGIVGIDANEDLIVWNQEGQNVRFGTSNTERMRVQTNGGISFNGDTAAANALDDYEEGTWTPSIHSGGGSVGTVHSARYTKIGRIVHLNTHFEYTTANSVNAFKMGGLPFACLSSGYEVNVVDFQKGGYKGAYCRTHSGNSYMEFFRSSESTSTDRISVKGNQIGTGYIIVSNTYITG